MSKRFGRNQKRKAKDAVGLAEDRQKRAENTAKQCAAHVQKAQQIIKMIHRINPNSVALDTAGEITEGMCRINEVPSVPSMCVRVGAVYEAERMIDMRTIDLYHLETELVDNRPFMDAIHFNVRLRNDNNSGLRYGYAASIEAMKARPEVIGDEISRALRRDLQENNRDSVGSY